MTIAVAVRTETAVVFAADSKVTTRGIAGLEDDGTPRWVNQTYDNATKIVRSRSGLLMAMVAGDANLGRIAATDFIAAQDFPGVPTVAEQDQHLQGVVDRMVDEKRQFWSTTEIPPAEWPGPVILIAAPSPDGRKPRVWRADFHGEGFGMSEVLTQPFVRFEGSYGEVLGLLQGYHYEVLHQTAQQLKIDAKQMSEAVASLKVLRPIDQINFYAMPLQDAMDLAAFLCTVQVEMDRFTPGTPACGGAIDLMALRTTPEPELLWWPGKVLHHPLSQGKI